jgi:hypothetical protein
MEAPSNEAAAAMHKIAAAMAAARMCPSRVGTTSGVDLRKDRGLSKPHYPETNSASRGRSSHVLPKSFHRIRHYGLFANRGRAASHLGWVRLGSPLDQGAGSSATKSRAGMGRRWRRSSPARSSVACNMVLTWISRASF